MKKDLIYNKIDELEMVIKNFDLAHDPDLDDRITDQEALKFRLLSLVDDIDDLMYKENIFKKLFKKFKGVK